MGIKIQICLETTEPDPVTLTTDKLILGWAELENMTGLGLRLVPGILREIAEQLESGMTTGPDEATWLADDQEAGS